MRHLGIIMDGNGRWAEERSLPRAKGHEEGAFALVKAIEDFAASKIEVLTVYAFSTENEKRNRREVSDILGIIAYFLQHDISMLAEKHSLKLRFIGNIGALPEALSAIIGQVNARFLNNAGKTVVFAIGYGGTKEVCSCFDRILEKRMFLQDNSPVTEEELYGNLYTSGLPLPDAVLRYGGYKRLSNFLPLQSVYSELFFTDKLWPDYAKEDIERVCEEFDKIKRNFGGLDD